MTYIFFSDAAINKIQEDMKKHIALKGSVIPRVLHHHRSYSTLNSGRVVEHGAAVTLSFVDPRESEEHNYIAVRTGALTVLVAPPEVFRCNDYLIDLVGEQLILTRGWPVDG